MSDTVSTSVTGQKEPKPNREERDEAFSSGAGRKAEDKPKATREHKTEDKETLEAPLGLDIETKGDSEAV